MIQLGNKPAILFAVLLAFAAFVSAEGTHAARMPVEQGTTGDVTLAEAIVFAILGGLSLLAGLIMLGGNFSYGPLASGQYTEKELRRFQQLEANQRRRVLLLVLGAACMMIACGAFAIYGKIGTTVRSTSPVKVNAIFFAAHAIAYGLFAAIFAEFMGLKAKSQFILVGVIGGILVIFGAAQYAPFGYWRGYALGVVIILQVGVFFGILGGSRPGAVVLFKPRAFAPCLFLALSFLLWDIFFMVGSPNENSKNSTLDSRSGTQLGYMGANISMFVSMCFCIGLLLPPLKGVEPPLDDPMSWGFFSDTQGYPAAETRRRGEAGIPLTGGFAFSVQGGVAASPAPEMVQA